MAGIWRATQIEVVGALGQRVGLAVLARTAAGAPGAAGTGTPTPAANIRSPTADPCRADGSTPAACPSCAPRAPARHGPAAGIAPGTRCRVCRRGASLMSTPPRRCRAASFSLMRSRASDIRSTAEKSMRRRIDQRLTQSSSARAQLGFAGAQRGLDQHLQLPVAGALLVVLLSRPPATGRRRPAGHRAAGADRRDSIMPRLV